MSHSAAPGTSRAGRHRPAHDDGGVRTERGGRHHRLYALVLIALGIGVVAGVVGLAPWLGTGMVLPLQNLWAAQTMPEDMPLSLLPLSQYMAIRMVGLLVTGGLTAALLLRIWSPARSALAAGCVTAGLLLVQATATVQSFTVLHEGLTGSSPYSVDEGLPAGSPYGVDEGLQAGSLSAQYFAGLLAGVIAAIVATVLVFVLLRSRTKAWAALGMGLAAVPVGEWVFAWGEVLWESFNVPALVWNVGHWIPALLVGLALAWCPPDRLGRAAVWVVNLVLLWIVPALFTAVAGALGTRVFRGDLDQMQDYAGASFVSALSGSGAFGPVMLAAALGAAGMLVRMVGRRAS